ncbi:Ribosomal protein S18 acetylase RimI [Anaerocolumna jejuensis DSM 15929]|uniref:Ribosomal protein S18 acetylase RimI n=1 Tax=Anaerocolumna jejuensis DSM 15929 TaxID=1121322 RepID=A0A1M6WP09_9FIRM|nr:N-acetyltransferase [Anaerocolumna jejuensis]SHK95265.1 Ribosomal protein S18 acetylase RimI [Anaerocolumna jejuensis DSM 15929]
MNIKISKGESRHLEDCVLALIHSELGNVYFSDEEKAVQAIKEGISKEEIYVAENDKSICLGFIWIMPKGAFHSFPYLHIIAVKEQYRGMGIGKQLLHYFEEAAGENSKLFLVVADFNPKAKELYKSAGYVEIGLIPDLYKKGVNECLMMKVLN